MAVVGLVIALGWVALNGWLAYFTMQITIGIWFPARASNRQLALVRSSGIQVLYPVWKWLAPLLAVTIPLGLLRTAFELVRLVSRLVAT